ncbi:sporulation protein YabP [Alkalibacillus haloalkaliphilus]|uniref:Sporulation protein YabP n=1 Tax=Alkalibacillus haloalkaliphilus TaxID=94136 RepID=A0A511W5U2_9BACI|nr:sporulation protein YabP [Alkalibacillus haloalkaliphilus]MDV2583242.1 sporulation protein YabP [Alkalibacillus haloalkaliphilus]GEN44742.1 sporulation protein YabP [Alkalibacillus haloalkaliphilus]
MPYEKQLYQGERETKREHDLKLKDRRKLEVTGVLDVDSFDTEEFLLKTTMGYLLIRGHNLHMKNLNVDEGFLTIQGKIHSFDYIDENKQNQAKGIFSKLFK